MASVKKGNLTRSGEWWKHLRWTKRGFWKGERQAGKLESQRHMQEDEPAALPGHRRQPMNEDTFNMEVRKFLKMVGVTSQREIELAVRKALDTGKLKDGATLDAKVVLTIPSIGLEHHIDGNIKTG
jgi:hypothetical protein